MLKSSLSKNVIPYFLQFYKSPGDNEPNYDYAEEYNNLCEFLPSRKFSSNVWKEGIAPLLQYSVYYVNLSYNDKRNFIYETMRDISEQPENSINGPNEEKSVKQIFMECFSKAPYAGVFQYYLAFEDKDSDSELLLEAMNNSNAKFDACEYIIYEDLMDVEIDVNYETEAMDGISSKIYDLVKTMFDDFREYQDKAKKIINETTLKLLLAAKEGDLAKLKFLIEDEQFKNYTNGIQKFKGYDAADAYLRKEWGISILEESAEGGRADVHIDTSEWNPLNFAIYYNHFDWVQYLIENTDIYVKKALKFKDPTYSNEKQSMFWLMLCFENDNFEMFKYLYEQWSDAWLDDIRIIYFLKTLFKSSVKAEFWVPWTEKLLNSETTKALFKSMSFSYRFVFIESLMKIYEMVHQAGKVDIYTSIWHWLSEEPYAMYFFSIFVEKFWPNM